MTSFNLADLWERLADAAGDHEVLVAGDRRLTYPQLEGRANRLAHVLLDRGVGPGDHVGVYSTNRAEFVETMLAAYKLRAVPININYRYVDAELRYIVTDSEIRALVYERAFAPAVATLSATTESITCYVEIDADTDPSTPGAVDYEAAIDATSDTRDFGPRSADDLYIIYTGGTTGMPKGTMWRHEDIFFAAMGGGEWGGKRLESPDQIADFGAAARENRQVTFGVLAPLMHGAAQWLTFGALLGGGRVVLNTADRFHPPEILDLLRRERVVSVGIVGDAMGRPLADELRSGSYDLPELFVVGSGGAVLSDAVKDDLRSAIPHLTIVDSYGSSELGAGGSPPPGGGRGARFAPAPDVAVLDEQTLTPIQPGDSRIGKIARRGHIPLGYWKDPAKSAATFPVVHGVRWSIPGDFATVEPDGTIVLLGRGSQCINTGGEKVFPEEVEAALKAHPSVYDAAVVGVPDERWTERVVAVVSLRPGTTPDLEQITTHCRQLVAGYKVPRQLIVCDEVRRNNVGKLDLTWAREIATSAAPG